MSNKHFENEGGEQKKQRRSHKMNGWLVFGVVVLILLLLVWLTIADFWGDTDVAADVITTTGWWLLT